MDRVYVGVGGGGLGSPASAWPRPLFAGADLECIDARESRLGPAVVFRQAAVPRRDSRVRELSRSTAGVLGRPVRRARNQRR